MTKTIELKIKNHKKIYQELTNKLAPYREKPIGSVLFIVEGTKQRPVIGIRYPGRKVRRRELKRPRADSALWANLYDFEVVPYKNGKQFEERKFTYPEMLKDFQENKINSERFWVILEELYKKNTIIKKPPKLLGIDSQLYLFVLKWLWIQEDFNYKFDWQEVGSPIRYRLETKGGGSTSRGAGRAKFFAALVLAKHFGHYFNFEQIKKIVRFQ